MVKRNTAHGIVVLTLWFITHHTLSGQCCSANPIVGSSNIGLLSKNTLRTIAFYRYNYSDTYYENDKKREDIHYLHYSWYSYVGNIISYGITSKITTDLEWGYYLKKSERTNTDRKLSTSGLNNGNITIKYGVIKKPGFECILGAGLKFPFSERVKEVNGIPLSMSLQPSTNAFGAIYLVFLQKSFLDKKFRIFLIHRGEVINGYNTLYYMKGNLFSTNIFLTQALNEHFGIILQVRHAFSTRDYLYDKPQTGTGSHLLFISPQINYAIKGFNIALLYDIPFYRYVNEIQMVSNYGCSIILTKDFNL